MFGSLRTLIAAAIIAASLAIAATDASAATSAPNCSATTKPFCSLGITWE